MSTATSGRARTAFVVLNAKSGCDPEQAREALERHMAVLGAACRFHHPEHSERLAEIVREAVRGGCDIVVAAGGDGTVSAVAEGLVGSETPLGIIPLGTANVLARELGVPVDLEAACALISGEHAVARIDAMEVAGKHYFTQVGVGIDSLMIQGTADEHKRRFGRAAYLWTAFTRLLGFQPRRFLLEIDGKKAKRRASQVLVANCGILGQPPFRWGPGIRPDDGRLDLCVARANHLGHYLGLGVAVLLGRHRQSGNVRYRAFEREVTIATKRPLPVQADGEIIGETPVTVRVKAGAVHVVVPCPAGP